MQGPVTTLPAKGIANNCSILNSATAVALAMAIHSVSPATISGDGFNKLIIASSSCSALAIAARERCQSAA